MFPQQWLATYITFEIKHNIFNGEVKVQRETMFVVWEPLGDRQRRTALMYPVLARDARVRGAHLPRAACIVLEIARPPRPPPEPELVLGVARVGRAMTVEVGHHAHA